MANEADEAQNYIERAYEEYMKRPKVQERQLLMAECDLCGEVARVHAGICIPCRERYRI